MWQRPFPISLEDDIGSLYLKIKALASDAIAEFLPSLQQGTASRRQQDHSQAAYWRKRTRKDGEIAWSDSTMKAYNLIQALTLPYVDSHTYIEGQTLTIWRAALPRQPLPREAVDLKPGAVFDATANEFDVRTADGYLSVSEYEHEYRAGTAVGARLGTSQ